MALNAWQGGHIHFGMPDCDPCCYQDYCIVSAVLINYYYMIDKHMYIIYMHIIFIYTYIRIYIYIYIIYIYICIYCNIYI